MANSRTPRGPNSFKRTELMRAVRAAKDAGESVSRVEIEGGKISLVLGKDGDPENERNEWDEVYGENQVAARSRV